MLESIVKDISDSIQQTLNDFRKSFEAKVDAKLKALSDRLESLPVPKDGEDGKSVSIEDVLPELQKMVAAIELPQPPSIEDIQPIISDGIAEAIKALPAPDISELINRVDEAIKSIPAPKDPDPVPTVEQVAGAMEGMFSKWALDFERKADSVLQRAIDKIPLPKDGKDGRDALDIEDFELSLNDDNRTVTMSLKRGDVLVEKSVKLPVILDRGVFSETESYEKGDAVSYGGSLWISQKDAPEGKPGTGEDWRLSVKRGRDGKTINGQSVTAETVKI